MKGAGLHVHITDLKPITIDEVGKLLPITIIIYHNIKGAMRQLIHMSSAISDYVIGT